MSLFTAVFFQFTAVPFTRKMLDVAKELSIIRDIWAIVAILSIMHILRPYSSTHPKRLWVQHCSRDICDASKCNVDSGLWITAFDGLGLDPLRSTEIKKFDGRYDAPPCDANDGGCYSRYPWSYPVAQLMRDSFFIPISPPDIPSDLKLTMNITTKFDGNKRIQAVITGPSHLRLILRDGSGGSRLLCWELFEGNGCIEPPPPREDGTRYTQLICGFGDQSCTFRVSMLLSGRSPVELTAHADYVTLTSSTELQHFRMSLPLWSRGAEWTNFASSLVSKFA